MSNTSALDLHPRFRRFADYLAARAPSGKLPSRKDIDPAQLVDLLPWMLLVDVVRQPRGDPRYRVRLMGTEVVAIQGADGTGKFADEILTGADGAEVIRRYGEILETHAPQYFKSVVAIPGREHIPYERVAFPLAADGEHVDMLVLIFARNDS